jgi:hypothetical protein
MYPKLKNPYRGNGQRTHLAFIGALRPVSPSLIFLLDLNLQNALVSLVANPRNH